jgi:hypothetical protein
MRNPTPAPVQSVAPARCDDRTDPTEFRVRCGFRPGHVGAHETADVFAQEPNAAGYWTLTEAATPYAVSNANSSYEATTPTPSDFAADIALYLGAFDGTPEVSPASWAGAVAFTVCGTIDGEATDLVAYWTAVDAAN